MAAFKTFKPDTSPGLSGWTHHLLATALRVPAFLKAIHSSRVSSWRGQLPDRRCCVLAGSHRCASQMVASALSQLGT